MAHQRGSCLSVRLLTGRPGQGWRCSVCGACWTCRLVEGPVPPHRTSYGDHAADQCGLAGTPYAWCGSIRWRRPMLWVQDARGSDG